MSHFEPETREESWEMRREKRGAEEGKGKRQVDVKGHCDNTYLYYFYSHT